MSLVEEYLLAHPDFDVRVHYIWMPMFPQRLEHAALPKMAAHVAERADARVAQYWDGGRAIGHAMGRLALDTEPNSAARNTWPNNDGRYLAWDAFFVFGPATTWDDGSTKPRLWGTTIVQQQDSLRTSLDALRAAQAATSATALKRDSAP